MAERAADVVSQIRNMRQLHSVVTAMRGIAASHTQQARQQLAGIETYSSAVAHAIGRALSLLRSDRSSYAPSSTAQRGIILFCAEQGFAGAFSEKVFEAAGDDTKAAVNFIIGTRGAALATEHGITVAWSAPMATNISGIQALANRITEAIYLRVAAGVSHIDIVFPRAVLSGPVTVERRSLLPVDFHMFPTQGEGEPPITPLAPEQLLERLAEEYVFAELCEAATEAFAAENEARMLAMTAARTNVETRLGELTRRERQLRQDEVTAEVVELAAGTEAMREAGAGR